MKIKFTAQQIEAWVSRNFKYKSRSGGRQLVICSPFDHDDDYHLWISTVPAMPKPKQGIKRRMDYWVHDFRPGHYSGSLVSFVRKYHKISYYQAIAELTNGDPKSIKESLRRLRAGKKDAVEVEEAPVEEQIALPPGSKSFEDKDSKIRQIMMGYLRRRGVSEEEAVRLGLCYSPITIVFPYYEFGTLVYWQERDIMQKRFNFPDEKVTGLLKTDYLYNFDNVEFSGDYVAVVESMFNCISIGDNCVASGGAVLAGRQIQKLLALGTDAIVLAPDLDDAGIKSLRSNYFELQRVGVRRLAYCLPPQSLLEYSEKDWNDYEIRFGPGSAKQFVESHTFELNPNTLTRLSDLQQRLSSIKMPLHK